VEKSPLVVAAKVTLSQSSTFSHYCYHFAFCLLFLKGFNIKKDIILKTAKHYFSSYI